MRRDPEGYFPNALNEPFDAVAGIEIRYASGCSCENQVARFQSVEQGQPRDDLLAIPDHVTENRLLPDDSVDSQ